MNEEIRRGNLQAFDTLSEGLKLSTYLAGDIKMFEYIE
jgi:hypothetical protein